MKILCGNDVEEIKKIIMEKAKFQKVMLLFDDYVSNVEVGNVYENIKDLCVFNQANILNVSFEELNNGYRAIIYFCSTDNFLKFNFSREDFINIYCPTDISVLPFYLNNNCELSLKNDFLILKRTNIDINLMSSLCFNKFYDYIKKIVYCQNKFVDFSFVEQEITQQNLISAIENSEEEMEFVDIKIIKACNIGYKKIALLDLLLIDALLIFIQAIKNQSLTMIDVYKVTKNNDELIDIFYSLANDQNFFNLITLNYNCLIKFGEKTKLKILSCLKLVNIEENEVEDIIEKIKNFSKDEKNILTYLYLYNVLGF